MCTVFETRRGFVLPPEGLLHRGERVQAIINDLDLLQRKYRGELEILFGKNGGFIICLPNNMDPEDLFDDTAFLSNYLEATPRIIDLARVA